MEGDFSTVAIWKGVLVTELEREQLLEVIDYLARQLESRRENFEKRMNLYRLRNATA